MIVVPLMQMRFTFSVVPELKIAAGPSVELSWISQFGEFRFAQEFTSRDCDCVGSTSRMQTFEYEAVVSAADETLTAIVSTPNNPVKDDCAEACAVPLSLPLASTAKLACGVAPQSFPACAWKTAVACAICWAVPVSLMPASTAASSCCCM